MTTGKAAAQAGHAAVLAYIGSDPKIIQKWMSGGHYTKLVMQARDAETLQTIERYINERGFKTFPIIDEGRTEIEPHQFTALGVEIVDKADEHVEDTFSDFQLYRDAIKVSLELDR